MAPRIPIEQFDAHRRRVDPIVGRAGVLGLLATDERPVLDPGDVARVRTTQEAAGSKHRVERDERPALDQAAALLLVLLIGAVAPLDPVWCEHGCPLLHPLQERSCSSSERAPSCSSVLSLFESVRCLRERRWWRRHRARAVVQAAPSRRRGRKISRRVWRFDNIRNHRMMYLSTMRLSVRSSEMAEHPAGVPVPGPLSRGVQEAAQRNRGSLQLRHVDAGSCNGCELEIASIFSPVYDAERFGIRLEASPRHADGLLVTGPVTRNMADPLRKTFEAVPRPRRGRRRGRLRPQLRRLPRRLRRRGFGGRRGAGRPRDSRLPAGPRSDHHRVCGAWPVRDLRPARRHRTGRPGRLGGRGACTSEDPDRRSSSALTIACVRCGFAVAVDVLHTGRAAVGAHRTSCCR